MYYGKVLENEFAEELGNLNEVSGSEENETGQIHCCLIVVMVIPFLPCFFAEREIVLLEDVNEAIASEGGEIWGQSLFQVPHWK